MKQFAKRTIGFDARPLYRKKDGVGMYTEKTIIAAAKQNPNWNFIGVIFKNDDSRPCLIEDMPKNITITSLPITWRSYRAFAELGIWKNIDKYINSSLDMFIYFNFVSLPAIKADIPKPLIIHDAAFLLYPETMTKRNVFYLKKYVRKSLRQKGIIPYTVSQHSADLLGRTFKTSFRVAYPGPRDIAPNKTINQIGPIVFIGTIEPRKNLSRLIEAYEKIPLELRINYPLVIAGKMGWGSAGIIEKIDSIKNIEWVDSPSDSELESILGQASCLVLPSIYEGFGIPALEAARKKILVITSENSPMQEFLSPHGGIFVDPLDEKSISNGLLDSIHLSSPKKQKIIMAAYASSDKMTWKQTAESLINLS